MSGLLKLFMFHMKYLVPLSIWPKNLSFEYFQHAVVVEYICTFATWAALANGTDCICDKCFTIRGCNVTSAKCKPICLTRVLTQGTSTKTCGRSLVVEISHECVQVCLVRALRKCTRSKMIDGFELGTKS